MYGMGNFYYELKIFDKAKEFYILALDIAQLNNNVKNILYIYYDLGNLNLEFNIKSASNYFDQMLPMIKEYELERLKSLYYIGIGRVAYLKNNYVKALEHFTVAFRITERISKSSDIVKVKESIAIVKFFSGNMEDALDDLKNILKVLENLNDLNKILICKFKIAQINFILNSITNNYDKSIEEFIQLIELAENLSETEVLFQCYLTIGHSYRSKEQFDEAMHYFLKAESLIEKFYYNTRHLASLYQGEGTIFYYKRRFTKAIYLYEKALSYFEEMNDQRNASMIYYLLYNAHLLNRDIITSNYYKSKFENNLEYIPPLLLLGIRKQEKRISNIKKICLLLPFGFLGVFLLTQNIIVAVILCLGIITGLIVIWLYKLISGRKYNPKKIF